MIKKTSAVLSACIMLVACCSFFLGGCNTSGSDYTSSLDYVGVYMSDNGILGVGIFENNTYKVLYIDESGYYGSCYIEKITENEVEVTFISSYTIKYNSPTGEPTRKAHSGATIKKENDEISLYLHFIIGSSSQRLVKIS